jgi:hypothetical protein
LVSRDALGASDWRRAGGGSSVTVTATVPLLKCFGEDPCGATGTLESQRPTRTPKESPERSCPPARRRVSPG